MNLSQGTQTCNMKSDLEEDFFLLQYMPGLTHNVCVCVCVCVCMCRNLMLLHFRVKLKRTETTIAKLSFWEWCEHFLNIFFNALLFLSRVHRVYLFTIKYPGCHRMFNNRPCRKWCLLCLASHLLGCAQHSQLSALFLCIDVIELLPNCYNYWSRSGKMMLTYD